MIVAFPGFRGFLYVKCEDVCRLIQMFCVEKEHVAFCQRAM